MLKICSFLLGSKAHHLILIDPKGDEFNVYKDIDTVEFINDTADAINTLKWLVDEMNSRYAEMAKDQITDISRSRFTRIVCIIDEFADLIKADRSIEQYIVLLTQKSGGCGIHFIIATQYPKADVITDQIQANIPTRVCLEVNSDDQSRAAIDRIGGEKLLVHGGDMLFLGSKMLSPIRIQAPYISDEDKAKVIKIAKKQLAGLGGYIAERKNNKLVQEQQRANYDSLVHMYDKPQQPEKAGFFQGLKNLWNAPQCTGTSGALAMRTSRINRSKK